jgi:tRNA G18 (ribose-2'-O)-methylase SpoU
VSPTPGEQPQSVPVPQKMGLSGHLIEASDFTVRIPMRGRCDSINVAVAAGILLFEMSSQQGRM